MPLPQTEIPGRLQMQLAERGIRMTGQRRAILSVIETATKHLDASQILRKARAVDSSVDRSTVYRTVSLLKRQGLIDESRLTWLEAHYHWDHAEVALQWQRYGGKAWSDFGAVQARTTWQTMVTYFF